MLFNILSCESSKNFSVFSSQEIREKGVKDEEVLDSKKEDSPFKNDLKVKVDKNKKSKKSGNLGLSDISIIGEARKDKSEIISFFFDLFDNDSDEVDSINKEQLKIQSQQKASKEEIKDKQNKIKTVIKPTKIIKSDLSEKPKVKREESILSKENREKISNTNIKDDIIEREVSSKVNNTFNLNKNEEELAFYRKKVDEKEKVDIPKTKFLKVGMLLPLTGDKKAAGDLVMNSLRYSMSTKSNNLIFKIYDTKGEPSGAVKAAKEGLDEGIKLFIGPIFSDETKELNSFFSNEDATFFSLSPDFSNVSDNVIVSGENPDDQIACIRQNLIENDLEKVLLVFPRNKYGQVIQNGFRKFQNDQENQINFEFFELTDSMDLNNEIKILSRYESKKTTTARNYKNLVT